jgi:hypothetical protein
MKRIYTLLISALLTIQALNGQNAGSVNIVSWKNDIYILVNISRLYSQDGHPTDIRGYYPPDYYIPAKS